MFSLTSEQRNSRLSEAAAALTSGTHRAGTLSIDVLNKIARLLPDREIFSVETGCGKSTILLSNVARHHTVFCYDDRELQGSSVQFVISSPYFLAERTTFVFGPTQETLPRYCFPEDKTFDLVLIDGPHGFPFPDMEFWHLYPHLALGGLLVIDDLMIPSISRMYDILREDRMFNEVGVFSTTGVLRRSNEPNLPRDGDHWWEQAYNYRRFPLSMERYARDREIRLGNSIDFSDSKAIERYCLRGFDYCRGEGVRTIDTSAILRFRLATERPGTVTMAVQLRMETSEAAEGAAILVNDRWVASVPMASRDHRLVAVVPSAHDGEYTVEFRFPAAEAAHDTKGNYDFRRYGCLVQRIELQAETEPSGGPEVRTGAQLHVANSDRDRASEHASPARSQALLIHGSGNLSAESRAFNAVLRQLAEEVEADSAAMPIATEVAAPPVLCPRPDSPVRFMPLGPEPTPVIQGLGPLCRLDKAWTFVDFAAFDGTDFAYAVYRSLLNRLPPQRKIKTAKKGSAGARLVILLDAHRKARRGTDLGKLSGLQGAKLLYRAWRAARKLRPLPLARVLRAILGVHAKVLFARHHQAIVQRRLALASLHLVSLKK